MDVADGPDGGSQAGPGPGIGESAEKTTPPGEGSMTVEVEGRTRQLPAEHDYTGDGLPDAALETPDGTVVVFADTEDNATGAPDPDGRADEAYVVDKRTGQAVRAAHLDDSSGGWTAEPAAGADPGPAGADPGPAGAAGGMAVETPSGPRRLPAERDYTGDGRPDAAVETADGRVVVFSDTEDNETGAPVPDGRADEAWIVDKATGRVVGAARLDPETGEWVEAGPEGGAS